MAKTPKISHNSHRMLNLSGAAPTWLHSSCFLLPTTPRSRAPTRYRGASRDPSHVTRPSRDARGQPPSARSKVAPPGSGPCWHRDTGRQLTFQGTGRRGPTAADRAQSPAQRAQSPAQRAQFPTQRAQFPTQRAQSPAQRAQSPPRDLSPRPSGDTGVTQRRKQGHADTE